MELPIRQPGEPVDVPAAFAKFCEYIGATITTNFTQVVQPNSLIEEWSGAVIITPGAGAAE
jgi:hypothetical protein